MKAKHHSALAVCAFTLAALTGAADLVVTVDPSVEIGSIKRMNAVNNCATKARSDQSRSYFFAYKAARIPFARTHDSRNMCTSGGRTIDISAIFQNFDADENDPASYDFAYTDRFIETIFAAGSEPFFRLGETIENGFKKYHTKPPKDFAKWARVCEHVMAHYLEGWANGFKYDIRYWEIWNEADAQLDENREKSAQWGGTKQQFFEFYEIVAKHLKKRFPDRKIGGPALGCRPDWAHDFLVYQHKAGTPIDFFSWHCYGGHIPRIREESVLYRGYLDENGYAKAESILDEWNYVKGWTDDYPYSVRMMSGEKGGAMTAAFMSEAQNLPIDMLMYYDARPGTVFNGMFDLYTYQPRQPYYPFLAWADMREKGTQVRAKLDYAVSSNEFVTALAARGADGSFGVLISRFVDDNNLTAPAFTRVRLANGTLAGRRVRAELTDFAHFGSHYPLIPTEEGELEFPLQPDAFIYIEVDGERK